MRDRLVELLKGAETKVTEIVSPPLELGEWLGIYADYLLANGVIVLPCKVGQTVYKVCKRKYDVDGYGMQWVEDWGILNLPFRVDMIDQIGKTVFLTKEEAEAKLKGGAE